MVFRAVFKAIQALVLLTIGTIVFFIAALTWSYYFDVISGAEPFSSSSWVERSNPYKITNDPGCVRGGMALDLIQKEILKSKTQKQVSEILGTPDKISDSTFSYELGQCSGLGWHNSILVIKFMNNSVHNLKIVRDAP
ncbi:hypothetical protein L1F06_007150 [Ectopseudomonas hydrolytica]|uniref:Uncharacterized protein n=1 Tax=Ectopseudomonas hydrolytica TaxID=2493633 RepID=A0ABY5AE55_9GAMM|nr:hypothetical protein [Pseudomonas hydrolytica]USR41203.1 hypothetical protein L1F06_007150 [Pseudomonas hydrolytica]